MCQLTDDRICVRNDDIGTYVIKGVTVPRRGHLFKGTIADNIRDMWEKGRDGVRGHRSPTN